MSLDIINEAEGIERLGDAETFYELIGDYIDTTETYFTEIEQGIASNDHGKIQLNAHSIKGSSSNLSLPELQEIAKSLEFAAKSSDSSKYQALYEELKRAFARLVEYIKQKNS